MPDSFGPVDCSESKFGECLYCKDENWARDNHINFGSRFHMVGPICGHRLRAPKRTVPQFKLNLIIFEQRGHL